MSHLTQGHFHAFGYIVSTYAKVEQGLKFIIAQILGVPRSIVMMLCEPYTSNTLRNVTRSINAAHVLPGINERITNLVGEFKSFGLLRNNISHNMWIVGTRPNSIKPIRLDIRSGKPEFYGGDDTERDWLLSELEAEAMRLEALHALQLKLLNDLGAEDIVDE
jgi:hypothetical protein